MTPLTGDWGVDLIVGNRARPSWPRLVEQPIKAVLSEPVAPLAHLVERLAAAHDHGGVGIVEQRAGHVVDRDPGSIDEGRTLDQLDVLVTDGDIRPADQAEIEARERDKGLKPQWVYHGTHDQGQNGSRASSGPSPSS